MLSRWKDPTSALLSYQERSPWSIPHGMKWALQWIGGKVYRERESNFKIQVSTFHTIFHKTNFWELFKLDLMGFPSSFSEKTHRFCHVQRKGTSLPGCAKVHQLHGKTIPTWGTSHQKQLWNPRNLVDCRLCTGRSRRLSGFTSQCTICTTSWRYLTGELWLCWPVMNQFKHQKKHHLAIGTTF